MYSRQEEALLKCLNMFSDLNRRSGIIQMPTGVGKTIVAAAIIMALYKLRTLREKDIILYLTPRRVLKYQVEENFSNIFGGNSPFKINLYGNGMRLRNAFEVRHIEKDVIRNLNWIFNFRQANEILICIVTPQGIHEFLKEYENLSELVNSERVKLILMDEIHREYFGPKIVDSVQKILQLKNAIIIGLSATPIKQAIEYLGPPIYSLTSRQAMQDGILAKKLRIYSTKTKTRLLENILEDEWKVAVVDRAEKYAEEILRILREEVKDAYDNLQGEIDPLSRRIPKTLIVAANTTEANEIARRLRELLREIRPNSSVCDLIKVAHYKIERSVSEIEKFRNQKEGILITVNMADMGFDDKNLEVLVIARPINSPIAYVQIRGRVLRKPDDAENLKVLKYALIIDLTESAQRHEKSVERVELGEFRVTDFDQLENDLRGLGEVKKVRGEVEIDKNYKIIEIAPDKETITDVKIAEIKQKILEILILSDQLTPSEILTKLSQCGVQAKLEEVEKACEELAKEGRLQRIGGSLRYPYRIRVKDFLRAQKIKIWKIEELLKELNIPSSDKNIKQVLKAIKEILEEVISSNPAKIWRISELSKAISINDDDLLKIISTDEKIAERVDVPVIVEYDNSREELMLGRLKERIVDLLSMRVYAIRITVPHLFSAMVKNLIRRRIGENRYLLTETSFNEQHIFMLRRVIAIIKSERIEEYCTSFQELEDKLRALKPQRSIEIRIPFEEGLEARVKVEKLVKSIGYRIGYDIDEENKMYVIILMSRA